MSMKFCKDCRFHTTHVVYAKCARVAGVFDMVTGEAKMPFCATERESISKASCGADAQFFQPREVEVAA